MVLEKVKNTIEKYRLLEPKDRVIIGLSGGADSVFLLMMMKELMQEYDLEIYAAHLNHQIRGMEAQKDAAFCVSLCDEFAIPCFVKAIDVPKFCKENNYSIEEGARVLRYNMFFELKEQLMADKVAIAHNQDDQAETILMRMMRGTGLDGLRGIEYKRLDGIIRPIMDISRNEIENYCRENEVQFRTDKTNFEDVYTRNKIRLHLIPYIKEHFNPNIKVSLSRMANLIREDSDFLSQEADKAFSQACLFESKDQVHLKIESLLDNDISIFNRIVRKSIEKILTNLIGIESVHIDYVFNLLEKGKTGSYISLPRGIFVYRKNEEIWFTNRKIESTQLSYERDIVLGKRIQILEANIEVFASIITQDQMKSESKKDGVKYFDFKKVSGKLRIRNRRNGDKIRMLGLGGAKKIKDLFIDLKIPKEKREEIPIVEDAKGILWVVDHRISEDYKLTLLSDKILRIEVNRI